MGILFILGQRLFRHFALLEQQRVKGRELSRHFTSLRVCYVRSDIILGQIFLGVKISLKRIVLDSRFNYQDFFILTRSKAAERFRFYWTAPLRSGQKFKCTEKTPSDGELVLFQVDFTVFQILFLLYLICAYVYFVIYSYSTFTDAIAGNR